MNHCMCTIKMYSKCAKNTYEIIEKKVKYRMLLYTSVYIHVTITISAISFGLHVFRPSDTERVE